MVSWTCLVPLFWAAADAVLIRSRPSEGFDFDEYEERMVMEHENRMVLMPRPVGIKDMQPMVSEPDSTPYNLARPNAKSYSQWRQDITLAPIFRAIGNDGFYVESGAYTGEQHSNTLVLEKRGWKGLLIEPAPNMLRKLKKKHRKAHLFEGALSPTGSREQVGFSGWSIEDRRWKKDKKKKVKDDAYKVVAEPLAPLLETLHQKTVDFWSLDIEGFEGRVLNSTDFRKVEVGVLLIEVALQRDTLIQDVMAREGFEHIGNTYYQKKALQIEYASPDRPWLVLDAVYVNPAYFKRRSLPLPNRIPEDTHLYDCAAATTRKELHLEPLGSDAALLKTC